MKGGPSGRPFRYLLRFTSIGPASSASFPTRRPLFVFAAGGILLLGSSTGFAFEAGAVVVGWGVPLGSVMLCAGASDGLAAMTKARRTVRMRASICVQQGTQRDGRSLRIAKL